MRAIETILWGRSVLTGGSLSGLREGDPRASVYAMTNLVEEDIDLA